jgi:hypothetical protein
MVLAAAKLPCKRRFLSAYQHCQTYTVLNYIDCIQNGGMSIKPVEGTDITTDAVNHVRIRRLKVSK